MDPDDGSEEDEEEERRRSASLRSLWPSTARSWRDTMSPCKYCTQLTLKAHKRGWNVSTVPTPRQVAETVFQVAGLHSRIRGSLPNLSNDDDDDETMKMVDNKKIMIMAKQDECSRCKAKGRHAGRSRLYCTVKALLERLLARGGPQIKAQILSLIKLIKEVSLRCSTEVEEIIAKIDRRTGSLAAQTVAAATTDIGE